MNSHNYSIFDSRAAEWDTPPRIALARAVTEAIFRRVPVTKETRALDFGSGTGLVTASIADKAAEVTAVDSSREMMRVLRDKADAAGINNIITGTHDIHDLSDTGKSFDLITSSMAIHHVADPEELFGEFYRLLKPGGWIALADLEEEDGTFHRDNTSVEHYGFSLKELEEILVRRGFESVEFDTAHRITRQGSDGATRDYRVFLVTARAPAR